MRQKVSIRNQRAVEREEAEKVEVEAADNKAKANDKEKPKKAEKEGGQ